MWFLWRERNECAACGFERERKERLFDQTKVEMNLSSSSSFLSLVFWGKKIGGVKRLCLNIELYVKGRGYTWYQENNSSGFPFLPTPKRALHVFSIHTHTPKNYSSCKFDLFYCFILCCIRKWVYESRNERKKAYMQKHLDITTRW